MKLWKKTDETNLKRELRAQRPQPRDEFVRMLGRQIAPARRTRSSLLPKVALVAAVTAALAVSLGVSGALGAAGGSVHSFSISVVHLVSPPNTPARGGSTAGTPNTNSSASNNVVTTTTPSSGDTDYSNATPTHFPFESQYGHRIPICWQGHIIYVTLREAVWYIFHGAGPARSCHH